ncbi:class I SAM-dependent methyltransferase [Dyadobacter sp. CY323]|uniref:class I SAM-dependent methyltransferase n=1 Tax=Dyadobacter sp. CY323 TaxID=2907302 RepID=UPI001F2641F8|nr:class I SAM-dependent methyltransferase [Dyadobacter sp. CY323]MCE6990964.1 class I SAM-dependent methyltransferase [Dyadobacter sp. CY323]
MKKILKRSIKFIYTSTLFDLLLIPFIIPSALLFLLVRRIGFKYLIFTKQILLRIGVIPIRDHYYEPLFNQKHLKRPLSNDRDIRGIDWNVPEQLSTLRSFNYSQEFSAIPNEYQDDLTFHFDNKSFLSGDAEYLYNIIRLKKPGIIIEIGSGNSTKIARLAIAQNQKELPSYQCEHICIEPYEMPWLEKLGIEIIRKRVEDVSPDIFDKLGENDLLFIDSSHMIRPQGDVLYEFLELLPSLKKGVIVHIHDIFSPKDYLKEWVIDEVRLWNEQYLLEAFLISNKDWKIVAALNYLHHNHYDALLAKCPRLTKDREPGSFYIEKIN